MKWTKITLETTSEAVDFISGMLYDLGIEGIEIEDNVPLTEEEKKQMFVDILPIVNEGDNTAKVSFYVDPADDLVSLLMRVKEGLKEISEFVSVGSGNISISDTEDKDWINNWKEFFKPFRIDDSIVIKPTWETLTEKKPDDLVIEIDPGISFGTGSHETTKLCILALKKYLKQNDTVLDAGSGSGILSIIASKLGAGYVLGVDIDPIATKSALENAQVNNINASEWNVHENDMPNTPVAFATANLIEDQEIRTRIGKDKFDLVVANILADVIIPLSGIIKDNIKDGGLFICSGIINTKEDEVKAALEKNNYKIIEVNRMGDWVMVAGTVSK
ncbi:[LSU ribosomal protein L11P]-lysine N-methyltransferase [Herbinix hemicellulosilytica]|uniref:Ribosomal protein L11 methyltransferase n=1 Tax=Herbinix hemicellulosilytica TaxID=1564487 RepID=A0A0H5SHG9_HERHM|nr:50S ribosomal protein L11 methyltransferase [Herbinix hemicellulosilytica]RBP60564.1 [LSU ribosomal protein L11P]-lysine N-methyltransferase [Herbinix hemicellulosilytica]CRZ34251.1 Ribosomal protein L11 methyltransferase [Herbinix hemicellulosilytica]